MASTSTRARRRRGSGDNEPSYTSEDEHNVKRILGCGNSHYQILCLNNTCKDEDVKKSYKKLALAVHPDRNKHPDAKRAFESIKKASDVLSDATQRKQYDDESNEQLRETLNEFFRRAQAQEQARRTRERNEEWREFPTRAEPRTTRPRPSPTYTPKTYSTEGEGPDYYSLAAFLIAFFVILYFAISLSIGSISISSFSSGAFFTGDKSYSFLKTGQYKLQRKTSGLKVPFYITSDKVNIGSSFERSVERDYLSQLKVNCGLEREYKRSTGSQHLTTPSCGLYRRLG